jgi:elongation factor P
MDKDTYEQFPLSPAHLGEAVNYLKDGMELEVLMYDNEPVGVEMPLNMVLEVSHTEPGFKGDTATGGNKPAKLETGLTINVPLFVSTGDKIRVDTRDGTYIERV